MQNNRVTFIRSQFAFKRIPAELAISRFFRISIALPYSLYTALSKHTYEVVMLSLFFVRQKKIFFCPRVNIKKYINYPYFKHGLSTISL